MGGQCWNKERSVYQTRRLRNGRTEETYLPWRTDTAFTCSLRIWNHLRCTQGQSSKNTSSKNQNCYFNGKCYSKMNNSYKSKNSKIKRSNYFYSSTKSKISISGSNRHNNSNSSGSNNSNFTN